MSTSSRSRLVRLGGVAVAALLLLGLVMSPARASGGTFFDGSPSTGAPPPTLGPYTMTAFHPDGSGTPVTSVPAPGGGELGFDQQMAHDHGGNGGWTTWSHDYTGDIYNSSQSAVVMTLPPNTYAFYFYAQSGTPDAELIRATAQDETSSGPISVVSNGGARYFGFYSTGAPLTSITVEMVEGIMGFTVGQFGIYVGEPMPEAPHGCTRADVAVVIYGGWDGIPVKAYVGGTEQETLYTAHDAFGRAAVLWTFYPPAGVSWQVSVAPHVPAGLDPVRWQYRLLGIETDKSGVHDAADATAGISRCSERVLHFQLVDTGAE